MLRRAVQSARGPKVRDEAGNANAPGGSTRRGVSANGLATTSTVAPAFSGGFIFAAAGNASSWCNDGPILTKPGFQELPKFER